MRYYLDSVQYNKVAKAENRSQTKAFNTKEEAEAEFYSSVGSDMKNTTLGGSVTIVYDSEGNTFDDLKKKWGFMSESEKPVEVVE